MPKQKNTEITQAKQNKDNNTNRKQKQIQTRQGKAAQHKPKTKQGKHT